MAHIDEQLARVRRELAKTSPPNPAGSTKATVSTAVGIDPASANMVALTQFVGSLEVGHQFSHHDVHFLATHLEALRVSYEEYKRSSAQVIEGVLALALNTHHSESQVEAHLKQENMANRLAFLEARVSELQIAVVSQPTPAPAPAFQPTPIPPMSPAMVAETLTQATKKIKLIGGPSHDVDVSKGVSGLLELQKQEDTAHKFESDIRAKVASINELYHKTGNTRTRINADSQVARLDKETGEMVLTDLEPLYVYLKGRHDNKEKTRRNQERKKSTSSGASSSSAGN